MFMDLKEKILERILEEHGVVAERDIVTVIANFRITKENAKKLLTEFENNGHIQRRMGRVYIDNRRSLK